MRLLHVVKAGQMPSVLPRSNGDHRAKRHCAKAFQANKYVFLNALQPRTVLINHAQRLPGRPGGVEQAGTGNSDLNGAGLGIISAALRTFSWGLTAVVCPLGERLHS